MDRRDEKVGFAEAVDADAELIGSGGGRFLSRFLAELVLVVLLLRGFAYVCDDVGCALDAEARLCIADWGLGGCVVFTDGVGLEPVFCDCFEALWGRFCMT